MGFKIVWSEFAENELDKIFEYYCEIASPRIAKNLLQKIIAAPNILSKARKLVKKKNIYATENLNIDIWFSKITK